MVVYYSLNEQIVVIMLWDKNLFSNISLIKHLCTVVQLVYILMET